MDRETFDRMFDEAFDAAVRECRPSSAPSPDESWERIRLMLEADRRRKQLMRKLSMSFAVMTSLLIGALLFGQAQVTDAFQPITQFFKGGGFSMFKGSEEPNDKGALTAPPPGPDDPRGPSSSTAVSVGSAEEKLTFYTYEEAVKQSSVPIFQPQNVPPGFKLAYIYLFRNQDKKVSRMYMRYEGVGDLYFRYEQTIQPLDSLMSRSFNKETSKLEEVVVGDTVIQVITDAKGRQTLIWDFAYGTISLSGNIDGKLLFELTGLTP